MPKPVKPQSTPFTDTKRVKELLTLMTEHGLTEMELVEADSKITLRRGSSAPAVAPLHYAPQPAAPLPQAPASSAPAAPAAAAPAADESLLTIKSPMVGTFYARPNPESPAFIAVGSDVSDETVVCVIEAMKVFNEIRAELSGTVTKILVQNGQAVEFNQPLFQIKPA